MLARGGVAQSEQHQGASHLPYSTVHAAVALNTALRSELLQGLCLFSVAAHRTAEKRPDAAKAAEIVRLVKDRLLQSIAEVRFLGVN